jgi:hypothetical protein
MCDVMIPYQFGGHLLLECFPSFERSEYEDSLKIRYYVAAFSLRGNLLNQDDSFSRHVGGAIPIASLWPALDDLLNGASPAGITGSAHCGCNLKPGSPI